MTKQNLTAADHKGMENLINKALDGSIRMEHCHVTVL